MTEDMLTIEEAWEKYPEEWVLIEIVKFGRVGNPLARKIVYHSRSRGDLVEPERRLHREKPEAQSYTFFCGPVVAKGYTAVLIPVTVLWSWGTDAAFRHHPRL